MHQPKTRFGWKADDAPRDQLYANARARFGAPRNLPTEALSLVGLVRRVRDQGGTSSCVGHACASGVDVRLRFLGKTLPEPSPLGVYAFARMLEKQTKKSKLQDDGSYPADAYHALSQFGVPSEDVWPFDEARINEELPWDAQQNASAGRVALLSKIRSTGQQRIEDVCNQLAQNHPVPFGTQVAKSFEDYKAGEVLDSPGSAPRLGGHMTLILGYTTTPSGLVFVCLNSWGTSWGEGGLYRCSTGYLNDPFAADFCAVECSAA